MAVQWLHLIHLHNIHGHYLNAQLLFEYIKRENVKVIWTLHDCWAFTGKCPHFTLAKCDKWKNGCHDCPQYKEYPQALWDNTHRMWLNKKKWFTDVKDMTIITPSIWLSGLVKQSFLNEYPTRVINNGINLNMFRPYNLEFRFQNDIKNI